MSDKIKVHRIDRKPVAAEVPDVSGTEISEDEFNRVTREGIRQAADKWISVAEAEETPTYSDATLQEMAAQKIAESKAQAEVAAGAQQIHGSWQTGHIGTSVYDYLGRGFDAEQEIALIREAGSEHYRQCQTNDTLSWKQHQESTERHYQLANEFGDFVRDFGEHVQDDARRHQQAQLVTLAIVAAVAFAIGRAR